MLPPESEAAPFFGSWTRIYLAVIAYLVCVIVALSLFTAAFRI
ncbi:hypothetical protein [Bryobacter aggregatus]|nr:hypothetical protein [Bryobacter aggregatus]